MRKSFITFVLVALHASWASGSNLMHVTDTGTGQVLLFPYYTARTGTTTLISLVNTTTSRKAVRINFREARSGLIAHRLNVYLNAFDVWTSVLTGGADGVLMLTSDRSCTAPRIPASGSAFVPEGAAAQESGWIDRVREGHIEVIEMATIVPGSPTANAMFAAGTTPSCTGPVSSVDTEPLSTDLTPPTGGLTGTVSFVGALDGMLSSTAPVAINNFWASGSGAPAARAYAPNVSAPNLTSGNNSWASLFAVPDAGATPGDAQGNAQQYIARFATSIDAVSALLTQHQVSSQYATTDDAIINTTMVITFPTKPYYIHGDSSRMFSSRWNAATAKSCDDFDFFSTDREGVILLSGGDPFGTSLCFSANPVSINGGSILSGPGNDLTYLRSDIAAYLQGHQNGGVPVPTPGKEGGWLKINPTNVASAVTPVEATTYAVDETGKLVSSAARIKLPGLPVIGFVLSQASYKAGTPQQNYGDSVPLQFRKIATPLP